MTDPTTQHHPWRKALLITEFSALFVLLGSMMLLSNRAQQGLEIATAWLLLPALASLAVFMSFLGLMYLRWVAAAEGKAQRLHKLLFALLAAALLSVWAYAIVQTVHSL